MGASVVDANLVNPWGLAFGPTGVLWVADNHTGTSTLYDADGTAHSLVVSIPTSGAATGGEPTGTIYNGTGDFPIGSAGTSLFIFVGEDGIVSAWNATTGNAQVVADRSSAGAVYKGLAIAANGSSNFLYATDFHNNAIDVFDSNFQYVTSFTDSTLPTGYAPFGIRTINGKLYVTFAKQLAPDNEDDDPGPGNGYVDVFNADGTLSKRFASNGALNAPWGIVVAPSGFGSLGGDILIGNFGDGHIGVYDATSGAYRGDLRGTSGSAIAIDGLWGLEFGPATTPMALFFSAGSSGETHGLLGTLTVQ